MRLSDVLYKTGISLKPITSTEADFKNSYTSTYIKGPHKFYSIHTFIDAVKVGELEYGDVDDNTIEIISIYIKPLFRKRGYAQQAINQLVDITKKRTVILMSSPSSKVFWKKFGFVPLEGSNSSKYLTKTF